MSFRYTVSSTYISPYFSILMILLGDLFIYDYQYFY